MKEAVEPMAKPVTESSAESSAESAAAAGGGGDVLVLEDPSGDNSAVQLVSWLRDLLERRLVVSPGGGRGG